MGSFVLFLIAVGVADPGPSWKTDATGPAEWPPRQWVRVESATPITDHMERQVPLALVVSCDNKKLKVYLEAELVTEPRGDNYDLWLTEVTLALDGQEAAKTFLRHDLVPGQLHHRKAKKFVRELKGAETLTVGLTPLLKGPSTATFRVAGLEPDLEPLALRCRL